MRGYLIDPETRSIAEQTLGQHFEEINTAIGSRLFCVGAYLPDEDTVFVDDEGLLTDEPKHFFRIDERIIHTSNPGPLCGRGLVLGADDEGDSIDAKITLEKLTKAVRWVTEEEVGPIDLDFTVVSFDPKSFDAMLFGNNNNNNNKRKD